MILNIWSVCLISVMCSMSDLSVWCLLCAVCRICRTWDRRQRVPASLTAYQRPPPHPSKYTYCTRKYIHKDLVLTTKIKPSHFLLHFLTRSCDGYRYKVPKNRVPNHKVSNYKVPDHKLPNLQSCCTNILMKTKNVSFCQYEFESSKHPEIDSMFQDFWGNEVT
jgi:hypothetical protein